MPYYLTFDASGRQVQCVAGGVQMPGTIEAPSVYDPAVGAYLKDGEIILLTPEQGELLKTIPSYSHVFDFDQMTWVDSRSLDDLKAAKWFDFKNQRTDDCNLPLIVDGRVFDATPVSQSQISGAVTLAMLAPAEWTIDWTLADNTVATLTKAEMIGVGIALGARTNQIYSHARTLRTAIEAATTTEEVQAVVW